MKQSPEKTLVIDTKQIYLNGNLLERQTSCLPTPISFPYGDNSRESSFVEKSGVMNNAILDDVRRILHDKQISEDDALLLCEIFKEAKPFQQFQNDKTTLAKESGFIALFQNCKLVTLPPGSLLYREGEKVNEKFYFVLDGEVNLMKRDLISLAIQAMTPYKMNQIFNLPDDGKDQTQEGEVNDLIFDGKQLDDSINQSIGKIDNSDNQSQKLGVQLSRNTSSRIYRKLTKQSTSVTCSPALSKKNLRKKDTREMSDSPGYAPNEDSTESEKMLKRQTVASRLKAVQYGKIAEKLGAGAFFGECAFNPRARRPFTAVTGSSTVELVELNTAYAKQTIDNMNLRKEIMMNFLGNVMPSLESHCTKQTIKNFLMSLEQKTVSYNEFLLREGMEGNNFFILYEGSCQMSRTVIHNDSAKMNFPHEDCKAYYGLKHSSSEYLNIANIEKGSFIGDEVLFNRTKKYEYNIKVTSASAVFFVLSKLKFSWLPKVIFNGVKKLSVNKKVRNIEKLKNLLASKNLKWVGEDISETFPLIVFSSSKLSYRPNLHAKSPRAKISSSADTYRQSQPEIEMMLSFSKEPHDDIDHKEKCIINKGPSMPVTKERDTYSLEGLIYHLHKFTGDSKLEVPGTEESPTRSVLINKDGNKTQEVGSNPNDIARKGRKGLTAAKIYQREANHSHHSHSTEDPQNCKLTQVIQTLMSPKNKPTSPGGEISLRLGSTPSIFKVDQFYSLMKNILKNDESPEKPNQDLSKPKNMLGFVPDDFEMDTNRKRKNQKQKEIILQRRINEIKPSSPKPEQDLQMNTFFGSYIKQQYDKRRSHTKSNSLVGSFLQISSMNTPTARTEKMTTESPAYSKVIALSSRPFSGSVRDNATLSTKLSRPASSIAMSSMRPFSAWSISSETQAPKKLIVNEQTEQTEAGGDPKQEDKKIQLTGRRADSLTGRAYAETPTSTTTLSTLGKLLGKTDVVSPRQGGVSYMKSGKIPKRAGGFVSRSFVEVTPHEFKNTQEKGIIRRTQKPMNVGNG